MTAERVEPVENNIKNRNCRNMREYVHVHTQANNDFGEKD
jgi:hypothetical protein